MTKQADKVMYCYCGPEISVASTKAFTTQLILLYLLALDMAEKLGTLSEDKIKSYLDELKAIPERINEILERKDDFKNIAEDLKNQESVFYTGRGIDFTTAKEGALKLKEVSYIHTEAFASGELKHGSIALIDNSTRVIAIISQEHTAKKTAINLEELTARGAIIYTITDFDDNTIKQNSKEVIKFARTTDFFAPLLSVIPAQLIAYYTSLARGNDVDKPRNLAKAVTVE